MERGLERVSNRIYYIENGQKHEGKHGLLKGYVSGLRGDVSGIKGDASGIKGDVDERGLTKEDREWGIDIRDLCVE